MRIAVIIPCFRVRKHILSVIESVPKNIESILVIDDACPENSGKFVKDNTKDPRVEVIFLPKNLGVGGAVMTGYRAALAKGIDIFVKIDGDGQMDPNLIDKFTVPIQEGECDYTKGNRFWSLEFVRTMPKLRLIGNGVLSLMNKFSSGYWHLFDPTNGYTALHRRAAQELPFNQIAERYFFESDMLFRLNTIQAVVIDVPMVAKYEDEESNLKISKIVFEFFFKHIRNFIKRIFYNYYLRDMSIASLELLLGISMISFGFIFGGLNWVKSIQLGISTTSGTVMLAALPVLLGLQLILAFLSYDIASNPTRPLQRKLR